MPYDSRADKLRLQARRRVPLKGRRFRLIDSVTVCVLAIVFAATLIRSTVGFGEALVAVPLLALLLPVTIAAPLAVLISTALAAVIVIQDWRDVQRRSAATLIVAALPGIPFGLLLLAKVNELAVKLLLGILIVGFSLYSLKTKNTLHLHKDDWRWLLGCGFLSGVLGGAYGMNGPPLVIYGALRRWSPQHFRATLQGYFLVASLAGLAGYSLLGIWSDTVTRYFLLSLPIVGVAALLGRALNRRIQAKVFFRFIYVGLVIIGSVLILQAALR
jgi:hypothetical protein